MHTRSLYTTLSDKKQDSSPTSFRTIAGALIPAAVISSAYIVAFLVVRGKFSSQYAPRTYSQIIPEKDRTPSTSTSGTNWFWDYWQLDDKFVLRHHSFDAFLFLRFFRMLILISLTGCALTWPILFPLYATGGGNAQQLDRIAYGNVAKESYCWGIAIVAIVFLSFVMLIINRERIFLINLRQTYITSKANAKRLSSRVVLFMSVPPELMRNGHFERTFGDSVKRTWKVIEMGDLKKLVDDRTQKVYDLESAELTLAQNVVKQRRKLQRSSSSNGGSLERGDASVDHPHNRPSHRSPPLVGQKLDSIDHILSAVPDLNKQISELQEKHSDGVSKHHGAVFVEFTDQVKAYQALQQLQHHDPLALQPRIIGVPPSNIKWQNLTIEPATRILYGYAAIAVIIALTIFWSIPVGIVATISNVKYLAENYSWLAWINKLPDWLVGFIQGFLPPWAISLLTSYVPFWLRDIVERGGEPTAQSAENTTQRYFFMFQFLQVFLVTTLSSGAATIVKRIGERPGDIPTFLADNLPKSSNFYITYFTLQGLNTAASQLIKYSDTFEYVFWKTIAKTPREKYDQETKMKGLFFGSQYPKFTNMAVIAIVYSCIAPLVLGFATAGFTLFYLTYRYLMLYTNNAKLEMKGACHARALQQILTGVYVAELCLIGLFGARGAEGPSILMIIFFVLTVLHHITVNRYLVPLEQNMPLDILQSAAAADSDSSDNNGDSSAVDDNDAEEPLLSSSESRDARMAHRHRLSVSRTLPPFLVDPLKSVLETYKILPSASSLRKYILPSDPTGSSLRESTITTVPSYSEQQIANAYRHPALTSKPPLVWLARDSHGVSEELKGRNKERADLETSDEGAELDDKGNLIWDERNLSKAPIFKLPTRF